MNIKEKSQSFESAHPSEILTWSLSEYPTDVVMTSSFGANSAALLHMAVQIKPDLPIIFLNTGFLFKETIQFVNELKETLNLNLKEFNATPEEIKQTQAKLDDPNNNVGACCDGVKVRLMQDSLKGAKCWIAGLRRGQGARRKNIGIIEEYADGLIKVHPFANWTSKDIYQYMVENKLPHHPLWEKGYTSLGCEPCTSLPSSADDERSGRWKGSDKTECGIHTFLSEKKSD